MPVKGAAGIMLADARAAVRNSASRRVIGPVICVLKMRPLALPGDAASAQRNTQKTGTSRLACSKNATTGSYHRSTAQGAVHGVALELLRRCQGRQIKVG